VTILKIGRRGESGGAPTAAATDTPQPRTKDRTAAPRAQAARACPNWTELDAIDLVSRAGRFLVHAHTDEVFTAYDGHVWEKDRIAYGWDSPIYFTVDGDHVRLLERYHLSWSEIVATQAGAR